MLEAIAPLAAKFCGERLRDDVNIRITSAILSHSEKQEPAFLNILKNAIYWIEPSKIPPNLS